MLELDGLALSLAATTFIVLAALLRELGALGLAAHGLLVAAAFVASLTAVSFAPPALLLGSVASAVVGLALYLGLVALLRPRGLTSRGRTCARSGDYRRQITRTGHDDGERAKRA